MGEAQPDAKPERAALPFDRYGGRVVSQAVVEKASGFYQLQAQCELTGVQERTRGPYKPLDEPIMRTAFIMLSGNNGRNEKQMDALEKSLGWNPNAKDANPLTTLQETDYSELRLSFKVEDATDKNGDPTREIGWINRRGVGGSSKAELADMAEGWAALGSQADLKTEDTPGEAAEGSY
ncbi:MAG: hypothetical protein ACTSX8_01425 [Alphaproteobacteria bacterium]